MRLAFSKPTRDGAELAALVSAFRPAGYEGLQLKAGQYSDLVADPAALQRRLGGDAGAASALIVFDRLDDGGRQQLDAVVDLAAVVAAERVVFCHDHSRRGVTTDQRRTWAGVLAEHAVRAADRGVGLSLHHHYDQPVMTADDARDFYDAVDGAPLGLTVDTAHLAKSGVDDIPAFLAEFAEHVDNIHLKDFADGTWRLLGQGDLDLDAVLVQLRRQGYDGWLCVDEESDASLEVGLTASRAWLAARL